MADHPLTGEPDYPQLFSQAILANLAYLSQLPPVQSLDTPGLDRERESLLRTLGFALNLDQAWSPARRLIEAISPYMERRGYWAVWEQLLHRALHRAGQSGDDAGGVALSLLLARLWQRQSNIPATIQAYRQTIALARRAGDRYNEARACTNMGYLFIEQGHWWRAEVLCRHALAIFEALDSQHGLAHTHNHLGILNMRRHCWWRAQEHLERACALWLAMGDDHGLMRGCINLSSLYLELGSPIQARYYLDHALTRANATGEEIESATVYLGLCVACRWEGNPAQAEGYARQAEATFRRFHHAVGLAQVRDNLGLVCLDQGKWTEAEQHFGAALQQWRSLKSALGELRVMSYLVEFEIARQNRSAAAANLNRLAETLAQSRGAEQYRFLQPRLNYFRQQLSQL